MSDVVFIYIMIGVAHFTAHVIDCRGCFDLAVANFSAMLDMTTKVFGWPIFAIKYIVKAVRPAPYNETVSVELDGSFEENGVTKKEFTVKTQKLPGETMDAFVLRSIAEAEAAAKKGYEDNEK